MAGIDRNATLAALVAERPVRAQLLERLRLDYCCGGAQSLAEACERRGFDAATVAALIEALDEGRLPADPGGERDWREAGIGELCDHLVSVHHEGLRRELPRISGLAAKVARVHGAKSPALTELEQRFSGLREDLLSHIELEERALFPACRALEGGEDSTGVEEGLIARHEADHAGVGEELAGLRELAGGYDGSAAFCGTHRALLDALRDFEADLHQHVHEENNVLFPRVRELAGVGERRSTTSARGRPSPP